MKTVILLSGKKETGKSTAAQILKEHLFIEQSFAEELKNQLFVFTKYVLDAKDVTYDHFHNQDLKIKPINIPFVDKEITPRYVMQVYGTEVMRNLFNENYWVDQVISKILRSPEDNHCVVDCRYPNEISRVQSKLTGICNTYTVRINRVTGKNDTHTSETSLDDYSNWNYIVDNNFDMNLFRLNINSIIKHIKSGTEEKWIQQYS